MEKPDKHIETGSRVLPPHREREPITVSFCRDQLERIDTIAKALGYNRSQVVERLLAVGLVEHDRTRGKG